MRLSPSTSLTVALLAGAFVVPQAAQAMDDAPQLELHLLTGSDSGHAQGSNINGTLTISDPVELQVELFSSLRSSTYFRNLIAYNFSSSVLNYLGFFVGRRIYLGSNGARYDQGEDGVEVVSQPRWRYFLGADVGFTEIAAATVGSVLTVPSSQFELGASAGIIYQVSKNVGIELQVGGGYGFGISDVQINTAIERLDLGLTIYL